MQQIEHIYTYIPHVHVYVHHYALQFRLTFNIYCIIQFILEPMMSHKKAHLAYCYRPISLTAICSKIMEHIIYHSVIEHLNQYNILNRFQYGFRQGFSCEAQLASVIEDILYAMDKLTSYYLIFVRRSTPSPTIAYCSNSNHMVL